MLYTPAELGTLRVPNRLVRSATAERLADEDGRVGPELCELTGALARGGAGLIITGHMYVHPGGKAHPEMTGIYSDELLPGLERLVRAVRKGGGLVAAQLNHGGLQCARESVSEAVAPSALDEPFLRRPARAMTTGEIEEVLAAFAGAARRARDAGFDAVQLHAAHGYLVSQFLSPFTNRREDDWGGDAHGRARFLRELCAAVRAEVGPDYPVFVKLGMIDSLEGGQTLQSIAPIMRELASMGLDGVELSGGLSGDKNLNIRNGIRAASEEAYFRPLARKARELTELPLILVGGLRSRAVMEDVLTSGDADYVSLCRPFICEPDLALKLREQERVACVSGSRCWPRGMGEGISCKCKREESTA